MTDWRLAAVISVGVVALEATTAEACSGPIPCIDADLSPTGDVPANIPALAFWPRQRGRLGFVGSAAAVLTRVDGDRREAIAYASRMGSFGEPLLVPTTPLVAGGRYEVTGPNDCDTAPVGVLRFATTAPTALPTTLGTIEVVDVTRSGWLQIVTNVSAGSCGPGFVASWVDARVRLSPEAAPWSAALRWSATLDGVPWRMPPGDAVYPRAGTNGHGFGVERFFVPCSAPDSGTYDAGFAPGRHRIGFTAHIPGHDVALSAETTVEILCAGAASPGDAGAIASDLGAAPDVGRPAAADVGATPTDLGALSDVTNADAPEVGSGARVAPGGCDVGATGRGRVPAMMLGLLVIPLARRRRRRGE